MSTPKLPSHAADVWEGGFLSTEPREVRAIDARGGLVVAGGADLYLLRPGQESWRMRPPPEDIGPMHAVAAEPRGPRRYAVAAEKMLAIFFKAQGSDQILRLKPQGASVKAVSLAWGSRRGPCSLWVANDDGELLRMKPDLSELEPLDVPGIAALASDEAGSVGLVSLLSDPQLVYVTHDGATLAYRVLAPEIDPEASVQIAVAEDAVALLVDEEYVLLSRAPKDPFVRVEALDFPKDKGWTLGPIAFQGATSDAALFCGRWEGGVSRIIRVDPAGNATSILEMGSTEDLGAPEIASLSWDASRQTLWGASPVAGIFHQVAPGPKGRKKISLS